MADQIAVTARPDAAVEDPEQSPGTPEPVDGDDLVLADALLVEDVSIDGMCGVY
jgi:mycofactocin precursor